MELWMAVEEVVAISARLAPGFAAGFMLPLENLLRYGVMALWVKRMPAPLRYSVMAFNRRWSITPWGGDTAGPSPRSSGLRGDVRATPALCEVGVRLMK
eukprot:7383454-Prymnesium_polylepis.1